MKDEVVTIREIRNDAFDVIWPNSRKTLVFKSQINKIETIGNTDKQAIEKFYSTGERNVIHPKDWAKVIYTYKYYTYSLDNKFVN
jgi:hypothetical protein